MKQMMLSTCSKLLNRSERLAQTKIQSCLLSVLAQNNSPHEVLSIQSNTIGNHVSNKNSATLLTLSRSSLNYQPTCITKRWHGGPKISKDAPTVKLTFILPDGSTRIETDARVGENLLQVTKRNDDIELEGACEGVCACSTCHLILPHGIYDEIEDTITEEEEDMLDMAYGLTESSRLGCQVIVTEDMDGMVLEMPKATRNFYVDGHQPSSVTYIECFPIAHLDFLAHTVFCFVTQGSLMEFCSKSSRRDVDAR